MRIAVLAILVLFASATPLSARPAQTTPNAAQAGAENGAEAGVDRGEASDASDLIFPNGRPGRNGPQNSEESAARNADDSSTFGMARVLFALGVVIGLILLLRLVGRRVLPGANAASAPSVVRVLSRTMITPKQQLILVKLGRRIVALSDNGQQLGSLATIDDPDDVAFMLSQIEGGGRSPNESFQSIFDTEAEAFTEAAAHQDEAADRRSHRRVDEDGTTEVEREAPDADERSVSRVRDELADLTTRARALAGRFRQSK